MFGTVGAAAANPSQLAENLPSSLVAMASTFPGKSAKEFKPAYGMAYRFVVRVDEHGGAKDLGKWQSCSGLKVEFNPVPVRSGGDYTSIKYLPGNLTYPKVTLKRAVERNSSDVVQRWLRKAANDWITAAETTKGAPGQVTITLHDTCGQVVMTWHLVNARPFAWTGPDLDANSSKVAVETLELVHEGFEVVAGTEVSRGDAGPAGQSPKLRLTEVGGSSRWVQFDNTPEKMTVDRNTERITLDPAAPAEDKDSSGGTTDATITAGHKPNLTKLILSDLYIVKGGEITDVADCVDLLVQWMSLTVEKKGDQEAIPYYLELEWGTFKQKVWLSGLKVEYIRFDTNGQPIRAKVLGLTLNVEPKTTPPKGNPTSGGIPGRSVHTLIHDENLPLLAQEHYGNTARWRDIAEANGVDDPLRLRPGGRLFLPAAAEIGGRR
jgi:phage tail-like protein